MNLSLTGSAAPITISESFIYDDVFMDSEDILYNSMCYTMKDCSQNICSQLYRTNIGEIAWQELVSKSIILEEDIMNQSIITMDNRPVHVYFSKLPSTITDSNEYKRLESILPSRIVGCKSWEEIAEVFRLHAKSICISYTQLENNSLIEVVNMIETFSKLLGIKETETPTISLGITKNTPYKLVKEAQKLNITGIIPHAEDFGLNEAIKGCHAQWNKIPYWPKHILDQLPGAKKKEQKSKSDTIKLTNRQEQILNLIRERGASNKVIAKILNITESTVKLHVGIVLKKFGVKNRTQLALFSKR